MSATGRDGDPAVESGTIGTSEEPLRLDGNAAAGLLAEIFVLEMTSAQSTCAHCGNTAPLGNLLLYGGQMGSVLRCPTCDGAQMRILAIPGRGGQYCLDMTGVSLLRIVPSVPA